MPEDDIFRKRVSIVVEHLNEEDGDFAVLTPSPNFLYLTGIQYLMRERLIALVITCDGDASIVAPSFEVSELSSHTWIDDFVGWAEDDEPYSLLSNVLDAKEGSIAYFDEKIPLGVFWKIEKALGPFKKSGSLTPKLDEMRLRKSESEIVLMKKAGRIIDEAVSKAFSSAETGVTESELKQVVNNVITKVGADPSFAAVQFGENSALPHAESGTRELRKGDIVLMDCGCSIAGYNTDMTRVGVVGTPTDEQKTVYSIVRDAQETALEQITSGTSCGSADGIARRVIEESGYGDYFTHRLGHGIGLQVHEPPYLVRGNPVILEPGMTHSIEPGVYLEGKFGIRIEDLVCVREDGLEAITFMDKALFEIETS